MQEINYQCCVNCFYSAKNQANEPILDKNGKMKCRRYPPIPVSPWEPEVRTYWPTVWPEDDWCGEWQNLS